MYTAYIINNTVYYESEELGVVSMAIPIRNILSMGIYVYERPSDAKRVLVIYLNSDNHSRCVEQIIMSSFREAKELMSQICEIIKGGV